jgi:hypothetical protein
MSRREILKAMCVGGVGAVGAFPLSVGSPPNLTDIDLVPDTLNLEDHARLSFNYLKGMLDEGGIRAKNGGPVGFPLFNAMLLLDPPALRNLAGSTGTSLSTEGIMLMRSMTGDKQHADVEMEHKRLLLADERPHVYVLLSLSTWYVQTGENQAKEAIDDIISLLWKGMIKKDGRYSLPAPDLSKFEGPQFSDLQGRSVRRELAKAYAEEPLMGGHASYPYNLEALVRIYQVTGNQSALELAKAVTHFVVHEAGAFRDDGSFVLSDKPIVNVSTAFPESAGLWPDPRGHFESRLRPVIGVLRYAILTGDRDLVEWSRRVFDWVQSHLGSEMGWYNENASMAEGCETCGVVCVLEIAVLLARSGYPEYWNIVERIARNHLIESQLTDISWVRRSGFKGKDRPETDYAQAAERMRGGFGGWTDPMDWVGIRVRTEESPQIMNCCVTGTHALYWVWHHIVSKDEKGVWVNLALNRDTKWVRVSSYQPYEGRVELLLHQPTTAHLRVPGWADKQLVEVRVDGARSAFEWVGNYVKIANLKEGQRVRMQYPLRELTNKERIGGRQYLVTWKGDTVLELRPVEETWAAPPIYALYQRQRYRKDEVEMKRVSYTVPEKEIHW